MAARPRWPLHAFVMLVAVIATVLPNSAVAQQYDIVIHGGRVIDRETGRDAVCDGGITGGKIATVSTEALGGKRFANTMQNADATIRNPLIIIASDGMQYLLVGGVPVVDDGKLVDGVCPGKALVGGAH